jgi:hypothetical protein
MNVLNETLTCRFADALSPAWKPRPASRAWCSPRASPLHRRRRHRPAAPDHLGAKQAFQLCEALKAMLRRMEKVRQAGGGRAQWHAPGRRPGAGLACHARIAIDDPKAKLGLPEVKLGLLPGGGGTQRLPRLIGIQKSFELITQGKELSAAKAKEMGLVTELAATRDELLPRRAPGAWPTPSPAALGRQGLPHPRRRQQEPGRGADAGHRAVDGQRQGAWQLPGAHPHHELPVRGLPADIDRAAGRVALLRRLRRLAGQQEHDRHAVVPAQRHQEGPVAPRQISRRAR